MADFTPGPWKTFGPSPGGTPIDDGGDYAIISDDGQIIAEVYYKVDYGKTKPVKANARLIAAAPAMYEALKSAAGYYEMLETATGVEHGVLREIRAALALADEVNDESD